MSSKKKTTLEIQLKHEDVFCIACRCIYIQPVTMPCKHTLCLECFKNMVNITAYQCPLCRKRISNWLRKYKHDWNSMVNESLWEAVQQQYSIEVQKKLNGEEDGLDKIISCQGFTRVFNHGEVKQEFDSFLLKFDQEQQEVELQSLNVATELQKKEEEAQQTLTMLNNELTQNDERLAVSIQKKFEEEFQQQYHLNYESDLLMAQQLQNQILPKISSKQIPSKKGPLDKMLIRMGVQVQCDNIENNNLTNNLQSSTTSFASLDDVSLSTSTSLSTTDTSSGICSDLSVTSTISSSEIFNKENSDTCTCGRLQDNFNSSIPPCKFCTAQIIFLDNLTNQKNDFLMAKELEKKLNSENFDEYNLRKRPSSTLSSGCKKIRKLSKGQRTLQQLLQENGRKK
ncbi:E3 ubiquitin-protein ligase rnf168-like [Sipha flava]|uniref:RING-type E3 ubiquitin transferase n=1 Tax=Sipha flava TaxID=143950 RepID=A0A2S2R2Y4_9HEMI|nr:E3 ubiquitin-protein ligase rnf168-like [Sipha flava]